MSSRFRSPLGFRDEVSGPRAGQLTDAQGNATRVMAGEIFSLTLEGYGGVPNNAPLQDRVRIVESTTQCAQAGAALLAEAVQQSICIPDFCPNPGEPTALLRSAYQSTATQAASRKNQFLAVSLSKNEPKTLPLADSKTCGPYGGLPTWR